MYFHYCSVKTFEAIMNSKVLWLSNLTKSNDNEEVTRTFDNLWSIVKKRLLECDIESGIIEKVIEALDRQFQIESLTNSPYGISFCKKPDALHNWLEYGDRTRGVVLGVDFDWFKGLERKTPHPSSIFLNSVGYEDVLYHDKRLEDSFYKICYQAIKEHGLHAWFLGIRPTFKHYSAFIKNPTFDLEHETRIVYYPNSLEESVDNALSISGLIEEPFEHYCLPWTNGNGSSALKVIGLGCNCELTQENVNSILENAGLSGEFQLFRSECSYKLR